MSVCNVHDDDDVIYVERNCSAVGTIALCSFVLHVIIRMMHKIDVITMFIHFPWQQSVSCNTRRHSMQISYYVWF